jgi:ABC-type polysaccharide/polyol phosphate transport system ATPase subunit
MNTIEVEGVSKRYILGEDRPGGRIGEAISRSFRRVAHLEPRLSRDEVWALRDVSLAVAEGEAVGVIGRNGAGKSTLLKILSRITEPTSGVARTRGRVTSLLEIGTGFHPELTGRENVYLNGAILGMRRKDIDRRFHEIVSFAGVERFIDTPVKRYSSGMYLRLAFSVAAHLEPDIMVVDEVLAVGDAEFQAKCLGQMEKAERAGGTVVFVSHNLGAITRLCSRGIWLEDGVIRAEGPPGAVVDRYLQAQTERGWEATAPPRADTAATLTGVRILDASGKERQALRRDKPFVVEVRFRVRVDVPGLDLSVQLLDRQGVQVLNEAWSDRVRERPNAPGEYVARLEIPPLLNVGEYVAGVWIGSRYETLLHETATCRLRLEGDVKGRPERSVVLDLPWQVQRMSGPKDATMLLPDAGDERR